MNVEYNDKGYTDIESPVFMTREQSEKFIKGISKILDKNVSVKGVSEKIRELGDASKKHKKWLVEELYLLVTQNKNPEEMARILGRQPFGIVMKRGQWLLPLYKWAKEKGISDITKKDIQDYINGN